MSSRAGELLNDYVRSVIRDLRIEKKIRVAEMAERTGIPLGSYSCLETGRYRLSLEHLLRLQIVLGFDVLEVWPLPVGSEDPVTDALLLSIIEYAREKRPRKATVEDVLQAVASTCYLSIEELIHSRAKRAARGRAIAARVVQRTPHLKIAQLARFLGRDGSTLSHAIRRLRQGTRCEHLESQAEAVRCSLR